MFFIGINDKTEDNDNWRLLLPLSQGKRLSKEDISAIMKKECSIPFENFELHEQARIMSVFFQYFFQLSCDL